MLLELAMAVDCGWSVVVAAAAAAAAAATLG
jgi:hypothetical protein